MKITKENTIHYFKCLKSKTNDPIDWIDKNVLSEEKFDYMNEVFDDLISIKQKQFKTSDKIKKTEAIKLCFENEKGYDYFNKEIEKVIKQKLFFKKTFLEHFLMFLNSINVYVVIILLMILLWLLFGCRPN